MLLCRHNWRHAFSPTEEKNPVVFRLSSASIWIKNCERLYVYERRESENNVTMWNEYAEYVASIIVCLPMDSLRMVFGVGKLSFRRTSATSFTTWSNCSLRPTYIYHLPSLTSRHGPWNSTTGGWKLFTSHSNLDSAIGSFKPPGKWNLIPNIFI